jgi:hypothetical protein
MAECGTHVTMRRPALPAVILKVGRFDDPRLFGGLQMAIYMFCPHPVQRAWYRGVDLAARRVKCLIKFSETRRSGRWRRECGIHIRLQAASVGIGGLDQAGNPAFDRWLIVS